MPMTINQEKAVKSEGNVLVSAGAGSGKTTVLTNRVIRKINEGINIDEFLVLTFTVAASKEMRERIKGSLLKNNRFDLIPKVDGAHIETFDAYALYILKKYGYVLGLTKDINNVPEDVIRIQKFKYLNEIFEEYYQKHDETFDRFINTYCFKDDKDIKQFILGFYDIYDSKLDKENYINSYESIYLDNEKLQNAPNELFGFIKNDIADISNLINKFTEEKFVEAFTASYYHLLNAKNFDEFVEAGKSIKKPGTKMKNDDDVKIRADIYKRVEELGKKYFSYNKDVYFNNDVKNAKEFMPLIIKIIKKLDRKLYEFQSTKGFFTFKEIANLAFRVLNEHQEIANEIKNKTKLIFIDEYQDTSDLQVKFIDLISNNNVFVVGDVKQSIYLFRGANPKNFMQKYDDYKKLNQAIDMNDNFRSRKDVVDKINKIFRNIMTSNYGGADYSVSHNLNAGNTNYDTVGKVNSQHGIVTLKSKKKTITPIIEDITKRINSHQKVYDRDEDVVRDIDYKDFAILSYVKTGFSDFEEELRNANIPVTAIYDEPMFSDASITVLLSLLKSVSLFNQNQLDQNETIRLKHYFISIKRSFLFNENDQNIYDEITNNTYINDDVYLHLKNFASIHRCSLISDLFMDLINEFNFIYKLNLLGDPLTKVDKISLFYERIKTMDDLNYTLDDFIVYLEDLNGLSVSMDSRHDEESDNSVKLTTIHNSKGLQYKIVYLINMKSPGKTPELRYYKDENGGSWLPGFAFSNSVSMQTRISECYADNRFAEEKMRLLYVALTRAEDTCVLYCDGLDIGPSRIESCKNLQDFIEFSKVGFDIDEYQDKEFKSESKPKSLVAKEPIKFFENNVSLEKGLAKKNASKDINLDVDLSALNYGTHMHLLMQQVDFLTKNVDFIKEPIEKSRIKRVLDNDIFKDVSNAKIYKEYQFIDKTNNHQGTIDLLMIYKDKAIIVDYKLKHIDDEAYNNQLNIYKKFVEEKVKTPIKCYLLSLIDDEIKEVF